MNNSELINKYAHCAVYQRGSAEYNELNEMTDIQSQELIFALADLGYTLTYNNLDDCFVVA